MEWNLLGTLFSAQKAERYDLVNRLVEPDQLDGEIDKLVVILLSKDPVGLLCTKYYCEHGTDMDYQHIMAFEGAPQRQMAPTGIADFVSPETRNARRALLNGFWFD